MAIYFKEKLTVVCFFVVVGLKHLYNLEVKE